MYIMSYLCSAVAILESKRRIIPSWNYSNSRLETIINKTSILENVSCLMKLHVCDAVVTIIVVIFMLKNAKIYATFILIVSI